MLYNQFAWSLNLCWAIVDEKNLTFIVSKKIGFLVCMFYNVVRRHPDRRIYFDKVFPNMWIENRGLLQYPRLSDLMHLKYFLIVKISQWRAIYNPALCRWMQLNGCLLPRVLLEIKKGVLPLVYITFLPSYNYLIV